MDNVNKAATTVTTRNVHVDRPLTSIAVAYIQDAAGFVADKVFPVVKVDHQTDMYWIFDREYFFRSQAKERAPGTEAVGGTFGLSTGTFSCKVYAFKEFIPDQIRANADLSLDTAITQTITQQMLLLKENKFAEVAFGTGVWANEATGADADGEGKFIYFNDPDCDPVRLIKDARMAIKKTTGFMPNKLVIGEELFEELSIHPKIIDRFKYTTSDVITEQMLAKLFRVDEFIVASAIQTTSEEGLDNVKDYSWIVANAMLLCYTTKSAAMMMPTAGYTFLWDKMGSSQNIGIKKYRDEARESDVLEAQMAFEHKVICPDLGYLFTNCIKTA